MAPERLPAWTAIAAGATLTLGCVSRTTCALYPDVPDIPEKQVAAYVESETGLPYPNATEMLHGHGRMAQPGRRITAAFDVKDRSDSLLGSGTLNFLYPAFRPPPSGSNEIDSGAIPPRIFERLIGMRVGGMRRFTIDLRSVAREHRQFRDARPGGWTFTSPGDQPLTVSLTLLAVCQPTLCEYTQKRLIIPELLVDRYYERDCR